MNTHKNARLTLPGRVLLIERIVVGGWSRRQVARAQGVSVKTVSKWLARWDQGGLAGLAERSSRPRRSPTRLAARLVRRIGRLRQRRRWTSVKIAQRLQLALATVVRWVRRLGLAVLPPVTPPPPRCRYERAQPGELVHVDTKRLARIVQVGHRITGDRRRRGPRGRTGGPTCIPGETHNPGKARSRGRAGNTPPHRCRLGGIDFQDHGADSKMAGTGAGWRGGHTRSGPDATGMPVPVSMEISWAAYPILG